MIIMPTTLPAEFILSNQPHPFQSPSLSDCGNTLIYIPGPQPRSNATTHEKKSLGERALFEIDRVYGSNVSRSHCMVMQLLV